MLLCVFLPASILPGIVGQLYRQFALVIAVTAVISAINAVTLKPTQCALWLQAAQAARRARFYRAFNAVYGRVENAATRRWSGASCGAPVLSRRSSRWR